MNELENLIHAASNIGDNFFTYTTTTKVDPNDLEKIPNSTIIKQYGWICPKCGAVMAPTVSYCPNCTNFKVEITC